MSDTKIAQNIAKIYPKTPLISRVYDPSQRWGGGLAKNPKMWYAGVIV
jgi:hypothetical protein